MGLLLLFALPLAGAVPVLSLDFTADDGGMATANGLQWQWAEVTAGPDDFVGHAWATQTAGDYLNDARDTLGLPSADLSGVERPVLVLEHWYEIDQSGIGDLGWLEVLDGTEVVRLTPIHGYPVEQGFAGSSDGFRTDYFDLSGIDQAADLRLVFEADSAVSRRGWFLTGLQIDDGDPVPPIIQEVTELEDTQDVSGPYVIHAEVSDDLVDPEVTLWWSTGGGGQNSIAMENVDADLYRGEIQGVNPGTRVTWWIRADDGTNTTSWPASGKAEFSVFLAAPGGLRAPDARSDGRVAGLEVALQWLPPDSPHELVHTVLLRDGEEVGTALGLSGTIPLVEAAHEVTVAGLFNTPAGLFRGETAPPLALLIALPAVSALAPDHGFQDDTLRLEINGVNLLLTQGQMTLDLGADVEIMELSVVDADTAIATVRIPDDAAIQSHEGFLLSGGVTIPIPGGFEVRDGADRPRLLEVQPSSVKQGDQQTIEITANAPVGEDPLVDLGPGVFVQSVSVQGSILTLEIATAGDTPVGAHKIHVDDGRRILDGASLQVRDARAPPARVCGAVSGRPGGALLVLLSCLLALGRRKGGFCPCTMLDLE